MGDARLGHTVSIPGTRSRREAAHYPHVGGPTPTVRREEV